MVDGGWYGFGCGPRFYLNSEHQNFGESACALLNVDDVANILYCNGFLVLESLKLFYLFTQVSSLCVCVFGDIHIRDLINVSNIYLVIVNVFTVKKFTLICW